MKINLTDISNGKMTTEQAESLQKYFKEGGTWQNLLSMSDAQVEAIYSNGYNAYVAQDFEKAVAAFSALIQLNPYISKHWVCMGATLQAQKEYRDAMAAYSFVLALNEEHIPSLFYSAQCSYALGEKKEALAYLEKVLAVQAKNDNEAELAREAHHILPIIRQEVA